MFKTVNRICCFLLLLLPIATITLAQEEEARQQINQAVFNKVEYHFNLQETDSIYALASAKFKQSLSAEAFRTVMEQQLYPLGRIQSAEMIGYEKNAGTYKLNFISAPQQLVLGLDSANNIETFLFQPYKQPLPAQTGPVVPASTAASGLDRFVDSVALGYSRKGNTHALAIGIISNGKTHSYFYGETEAENKRLPDENTLFEIGSITKTFTATLLAYFAQQELLNLDDPITKYLPDSLAVNPSLQQITLKQLANHTSGLPRLPANLERMAAAHPGNPYEGYTRAHLYAFLKTYEADIAPDSIYAYSNLGYGILGDILSTVSGKSFAELVREIIGTPLELNNTTAQPDTAQQYLAKGYNEKGTETPHWTFNEPMTAVRSLKSTVSDLLRYTRAHFKLPETALENALALTREFTFFTPPDTDIGLAWQMNLIGGSLTYRHSGETGGSSSFVAFSPDRRVAIVVLSNTAEPVSPTAATILDYILNMP